MTTPTHVEAWDAIPRDLDTGDHSRHRGSMAEGDSADAQSAVYLGNGLAQIDYVDCPHKMHFFNIGG
ncbi:hypothetical protein [Sphingomonas melonis]|uniref:hypothetical protein n=1 Tax=Sphingomonas melonis TaxID=152682 RepID=UPI0035C80BB6